MAHLRELLLRHGRALAVANDDRGMETLELAAERLLAAGNYEAAAEAHAFMTEALQLQGLRDAAFEHSEKALELVRDAPASPAKARVLTESSRLLALAERKEAAAVAQEAYEMAVELGLAEVAARALANRALDKSFVLDFDGAVADLERSIELARSVGSPEEARACHNLGSASWFSGQLERATELFAEAGRLNDRFGTPQMGLASRAVLCATLTSRGIWDEALGTAEDLIAHLETRGDTSYFEYHLRWTRSRIGLARGFDEELVVADAKRAVEVGRSARDRQALIPMLSSWAFIAAEFERLDEALAAAQELASLLATRRPSTSIAHSRSLGSRTRSAAGTLYGGSRSPRRRATCGAKRSWPCSTATSSAPPRHSPRSNMSTRGTPVCWEASAISPKDVWKRVKPSSDRRSRSSARSARPATSGKPRRCSPAPA